MKPDQQKKQMWFYIIFLMILIFSMWLFFMPKELAGKKVSNPDQSIDIGSDLSKIKNEFMSGVNSIKNTLDKINK